MANIPKDAYVMIIGAMKCGTSSLYHYLIQNPVICPGITKEPEFFSDHQAHRYKGVTKYEALWNFNPDVHHYVLDGSTGYTKYPEEPNIPKKIYEYGITPRFIYVVRNPFDRILSQYRHYLREQPKFNPSTPLTYDGFVSVSNYYLQLERYRPYFPRNRFLVLEFDELQSTPEVSLKKVYGFLGIEGVTPNRYAVYNRTPPKTDIALARSPLLRFVASVAPGPVRRLGKRIVSRAISERQFNKREREKILSLLRDDMRRFQTEYGVDVSKWGWT